MSEITLDKHQRSDALDKLIKYFNDEMQQDIGQFEAEFLLDIISKEVGNFFYNQGLQDAGRLFENKLEDIQHHLYELEKPTY